MKNIKIKEFPYSDHLKPIISEIFENINYDEFDLIGDIDKSFRIDTYGNAKFMDIGFDVDFGYYFPYISGMQFTNYIYTNEMRLDWINIKDEQA